LLIVSILNEPKQKDFINFKIGQHKTIILFLLNVLKTNLHYLKWNVQPLFQDFSSIIEVNFDSTFWNMLNFFVFGCEPKQENFS